MVNESENKETDAVAGLLGSLPRVEAPNDFDFRVKARIAAGQPVRVSWFPSVVRVAVPLGLVLSVGGYFGYQSVYHSVTPETAVVANTEPKVGSTPAVAMDVATTNPAASPVSNDITSDKMVVKPPVVDDKMIAGSNTGPVKSVETGTGVPINSDGPGGGSIDTGLKESRKVYAKGVDPRTRVLIKPHEFENPAPISAKDVITQFGADIVYSESGWKVTSVRGDSIAEKAGLKSGDVVEALNDKRLAEKTTFRGPFASKSIRIKRDGQTVLIDLNKKP